MSELGFTGKVPVANLTRVGDVSGTLLQREQLDLQANALEQKKRAAQAEKLKKMQANAASVQAQLGGLLGNVHPYALPFVNEAYSQLQTDAMKFMYVEGGADMFKPFVANFKSSVQSVQWDEDMRKQEGLLTSMVPMDSPQRIAANKDAGDFYNIKLEASDILTAREYEYEQLMQGAQLDYKNGTFKVMGMYNLPGEGVTDYTMRDLTQHPKFNDINVFEPQYKMVSPMTLAEFGQDIKTNDKGAFLSSGWNADRISNNGKGGYAHYYSGALNFDDIEKTKNQQFQWRLAAFMDTKDAVRERNIYARNLSDEELLQYYSLNPSVGQAGDEALFGAVEQVMQEAWTNKTLPHTYWESDDDSGKGQKKLNILTAGTTAVTQLSDFPRDAQTGEVDSRLVFDATSNTQNSVIYPMEELPAHQAETINLTLLNPNYYRQVKLFTAMKDANGNPLAVIDDAGRLQFNVAEENFIDPTTGQLDEEKYAAAIQEAQAMGELMTEVNQNVDETLDGIAIFRDNPTKYQVVTDKGNKLIIDTADLRDPLEQMIHASIRIGLEKANMTIEDLWNDAATKFGSRPPAQQNTPGTQGPGNNRGQ